MMGLPLSAALIELKANQTLDDLVTALAPIQTAYYRQHGRYWQGILTHTTPPPNGVPTPPDTTRHPTDQDQTWKDVDVPLPPLMECAAAVDVYASDTGDGYVISILVNWRNQTYKKALGVGPEKDHTHDWRNLATGPT